MSRLAEEEGAPARAAKPHVAKTLLLGQLGLFYTQLPGSSPALPQGPPNEEVWGKEPAMAVQFWQEAGPSLIVALAPLGLGHGT